VPLAPKLRKFTVNGVDVFNPLASITIFQYNPGILTLRLDPMYLCEANGAIRFKARSNRDDRR